MTIDTQLTELIINTLSPEQMPEHPSDTEIYLVEDDVEYATVEELATKQDIITDLDSYVKNTDYAGADKAGIIKASPNNGTSVSSGGYLMGSSRTLDKYNGDSTGLLICKGTLENIKEDLVTGVGDSKYQAKLTAGENITIDDNNVISSIGGGTTYTAGNGIDITNNKISTNTQFNITEDMFDIEYDDTKGVAPYNTSYGYTNVTIKEDAGIEWVDGGIYTFVLDTKVATSTYRNVRLRIGESGDWKPLMGLSSAIAAGSTFFIKARAIPFQYKSTYIEDGALHTMYYDTDTTYTINYMYDAGRYHSGDGTYAITRYSFVLQKPDGTWEKVTDTTKNYSTATTKTVNKRGFILNQIKYYRYTSAYANGALVGANYLCPQYAELTGAYSFNCGTAPGWAVGDYIYLVGTIGVDGLFYLDETKWWDNALPTTNDGKIYIQLGSALTTTDSTMTFLNDRPIYYHDGTGIKQYIVHDSTKQDIISDLQTIRDNASAVNEKADISSVDGQWVNANFEIASGVTYTGTSVTYDLSSYLPNDGYNYEVIFSGNVTTGSATGNIARLRIRTDIVDSATFLCAIQTRSNSSVQSGGSVVLPVGSGRTVTVYQISSDTGSYYLNADGYRRLGTNQ